LNLEAYGYDAIFEKLFEGYDKSLYQAGRISLEYKHLYRVLTNSGEILADISGKMRFEAQERGDYPAIGDWVVVGIRPEEGKGTIHAILPRKSKFSRKMAGRETEEQIVASNVDTLFIVTALNQDFNLRRLERFLVLAWESGATPVVVLSKSDLSNDVEEKRIKVENIAFGVSIVSVSAQTGAGMEDLKVHLKPGETVALLGSSGVGKSTIVNYFMGENVQKTREVRDQDARGRHTTTHRELLLLPGGSILIDTPGMRELQLWDADEGIHGTFEDIENFAAQCQFSDCGHELEPNCAVKSALDQGILEQKRFESYRKLQRELTYLASKENRKVAQAHKEKWKAISKHQKSVKKHK
jgi:ribosome biogenesis GTPase